MNNLTLHVKRKWFQQIQAGTKAHEYRLYNNYWRNRLEGKTFDQLTICLGYPDKDDAARRITLPWRGYEIQNVKCEEWDNIPQTVFAIRLHAAQ